MHAITTRDIRDLIAPPPVALAPRMITIHDRYLAGVCINLRVTPAPTDTLPDNGEFYYVNSHYADLSPAQYHRIRRGLPNGTFSISLDAVSPNGTRRTARVYFNA